MEYGERVIDRVRVRTALDGAMPRRVHFTSLFGVRRRPALGHDAPPEGTRRM